MGGFFYFFFILFLFGFSECSNKLFDFIQIISYLIYINGQLPYSLEIFYIALVYFQKNIFPNFGATYNEASQSSPSYQKYFNHIVIDQEPYQRIKDRIGLSSSYILNGMGLFYLSLIGWVIYGLLSKLNIRKLQGIKEKIIYNLNLSLCIPNMFYILLQTLNYSEMDRFNRFSFYFSIISIFYQLWMLFLLY